MAAIKVFNEQDATGTSLEVEIFGAHTMQDFTPNTPGVISTNGLISIAVKNDDAAAATIKVEWSPDKTEWCDGVYVDILSGSQFGSMFTFLTSANTGSTNFGLAVVDGNDSVVRTFPVLARYVRLNMTAHAGTGYKVSGWIDAV